MNSDLVAALGDLFASLADYPALAPLLPLLLMLVWLLRGNRRARQDTKPAGRWAIIDGSNVMHWADNDRPSIRPVREVIGALSRQGFDVAVLFDANAGYKLIGRYADDGYLAQQLGLPERQVYVVPKGQIADPMILKLARDKGARIITNDRYRDWAGDFPEVARRGFLVRGDYNQGQLRLNMPTRH